jgi:hypothetical protein
MCIQMDLGYVDSFVYQHYMPGPFALYYPHKDIDKKHIYCYSYKSAGVHGAMLQIPPANKRRRSRFIN